MRNLVEQHQSIWSLYASWLWVMMFALALVGTTTVRASATSFTLIDADVPGTVYTEPLGINNRGQIVGTYLLSVPDQPSRFEPFFVGRRGQFRTLDLPDQFDSIGAIATDINQRGAIVGAFGRQLPGDGGTNYDIGFLRERGGNFTPILVPGAVGTQPRGINNAGEIAGTFSFSNVNGGPHGFFRDRQGAFHHIRRARL
jgi:hypothetical protein